MSDAMETSDDVIWNFTSKYFIGDMQKTLKMISVGVRRHPFQANSLLKPDALGRTDTADDKSGYNERQDTNRECDDIQQKHP